MSRAMRNQRRLIFVGQKILIPISVVNSKQEDNGCPGPGAVTGTTPVSVAPPSLEPVCRAESGQGARDTAACHCASNEILHLT